MRIYLFSINFIALIVAVLCQGGTKIPTEVIDLNDKFTEVKDEGNWFVEFYAPWCGHCKRLHPIWEQIGHALAGSDVRVGRLDCTRFTGVASALDVHGFPTLIFFRHGKAIHYNGDRSKDALVDFALKAIGPEVRLHTESSAKFVNHIHMPHYKGGYFLLAADEDDRSKELKAKYHAVAQEFFTKAYFYESPSHAIPTNMTFADIPFVAVLKNDAYYLYNEDKSELSSWVDRERFTLYPEITYGNLYDLGSCCRGQRLLVMIVSDLVERSPKKGVEDTPTRKFDLMLQATARKYYAELNDHFQFGWTDGNEVASGIVLASLPIPSLVVFNYSSYQYYLPDDPPSEMTPESIKLYLENVLGGAVEGMGGKGFVQRVKRMLFDVYTTLSAMFINQPLLSICLFGLPLGLFSIICYALCSADLSDEDAFPAESEDDTEDDHEKVD